MNIQMHKSLVQMSILEFFLDCINNQLHVL